MQRKTPAERTAYNARRNTRRMVEKDREYRRAHPLYVRWMGRARDHHL